MKYELTNETTQTDCGITLYRIRALRDLPGVGVKAGDLGGFIERLGNLFQGGDCWVSGNARVCDDALVSGDARVCDDAWVAGDAQVYGNAQVSGDAWVSGGSQVCGDTVIKE